jgi:dolichol-phosphate mannosyltransferase
MAVMNLNALSRSQRAVLIYPSVIVRLGKFLSVGASGSAINLVVFWFLTGRLEVNYLVASATAFELAMCSNYVWNNTWTFADRRRSSLSHVRGLVSYQIVAMGALAINLVVLQFLHGWLGVNALVSNVLAIGAGAGWNFTLSVFWTWRIAHTRGTTERAASGGPLVIDTYSRRNQFVVR